MDKQTAFGLFAVTSMLVCYALENRHSHFILAFAGACMLGSFDDGMDCGMNKGSPFEASYEGSSKRNSSNRRGLGSCRNSSSAYG